MSGFLTTHVLDTSLGVPAVGVGIDLYRLLNKTRELVATVQTNQDGRTNEPILGKTAFRPGTYELVFKVGDYLKGYREPQSEDLPFLDEIPIRFGMASNDHYHVPLLLSPFGYSTYRGS